MAQNTTMQRETPTTPRHAVTGHSYWDGCTRLHEGCGGYVYWTESPRPGTQYTGECRRCGEWQIPVEQMLPVEIPDDMSERELIDDEIDADVAADVEWPDKPEWSWEQSQEQVLVELGILDGMECPGCGEEHADWEDEGKHPAGPGHRGVVRVWECGRCGNTVEIHGL